MVTELAPPATMFKVPALANEPAPPKVMPPPDAPATVVMVGVMAVPLVVISATLLKLVVLVKLMVLPATGPVLNADKMPENLPLLALNIGLAMVESTVAVISVTLTLAAVLVKVTFPAVTAPVEYPVKAPVNANEVVSAGVALTAKDAKAVLTCAAVWSTLARKVRPATVTDWPAFSALKVTSAVSVDAPVPCVTATVGDSGMMAPATPGITADAEGAVPRVKTLPLLVVNDALPENVPV